ncbi:MAG: hypothetical protein ACPGJS_19435 [Flammeovirgaceae bacterium]
MRIITCLAAILYLLYPTIGWTQGCSDAGFCTMGALKPDQKFRKRQNIKVRSIEISHYYGTNRFGDQIFSYTLDANISFSDYTYFQVKLPYTRVNGTITDTHGFGDVSLSLTQNLYQREAFQINATIGAKIPIGRPNLQWRGRDLPMYYQTTLGTYDAVVGISLISRKWLVAVGYQQALTETDNHFLREEWEGTRWFETAVEYPPSSGNLLRGKDLMYRIERNIRFSKFNINLGILHVHRLTKDKVDHPSGNTTSERGELEMTNGAAITGLVGIGYHFSPKTSIKIMNGWRLKKRHYNPDGLSRDFVNTVALQIKF